MTVHSIDWDEELPTTPAEEYQALIRALRRTQGFGIIFVRCNDADEEPLIRSVKENLPQKTIDQLQLTADSTNFYEAVENLPNREQINILFVRGLKHSLYAYEQTKRVLGWTDSEIHAYSWKGVPKILANLNQQRDRLRNNFNICFIFLLPLFAIKYLIHRAPDFYDWRSGIFEFPMEREAIDREFDRVTQEGDYDDYLTWTNAQRYRKLAEIQDLLAEPQLPHERKVDLLLNLASLAYAAGEYKNVVSGLEEVLKLKPGIPLVWYNRGLTMNKLERYEEAIDSFNKALAIKPDDHEAYYNRGIALANLGRYEEALASYTHAVEIKPDDHEAYYNRGIALANLGRYEEALASYNKALEINPDAPNLQYDKACCFALQNKVDEAIDSLQRAIELKPEYREMAETDSDFDNIRSDDRFKALIEENSN